MLRNIVVTWVALLCGCKSDTDEVPTTTPANESAATSPRKNAPTPADWVESDDGKLALRLVASRGDARGTPIQITAQLRNCRDLPITVLRPFADWYVAESSGIKVWDEARRIRYTGPIPTYPLGTSASGRANLSKPESCRV